MQDMDQQRYTQDLNKMNLKVKKACNQHRQTDKIGDIVAQLVATHA